MVPCAVPRVMPRGELQTYVTAQSVCSSINFQLTSPIVSRTARYAIARHTGYSQPLPDRSSSAASRASQLDNIATGSATACGLAPNQNHPHPHPSTSPVRLSLAVSPWGRSSQSVASPSASRPCAQRRSLCSAHRRTDRPPPGSHLHVRRLTPDPPAGRSCAATAIQPLELGRWPVAESIATRMPRSPPTWPTRHP